MIFEHFCRILIRFLFTKVRNMIKKNSGIKLICQQSLDAFKKILHILLIGKGKRQMAGLIFRSFSGHSGLPNFAHVITLTIEFFVFQTILAIAYSFPILR